MRLDLHFGQSGRGKQRSSVSTIEGNLTFFCTCNSTMVCGHMIELAASILVVLPVTDFDIDPVRGNPADNDWSWDQILREEGL